MKVYDEFCCLMNEVKDWGWKKSWNYKIGFETFKDFSRMLSDSDFLMKIEDIRDKISEYTGFVKVDNDFLFDFNVSHRSDFLYFEKGRLRYSQGLFFDSSTPINKNVFYDNNYCIERNYDINNGMSLSKIVRRVKFEGEGYKIISLQEIPDFIDFYVFKKNGLISFSAEEGCREFYFFRKGVEKDWRMKHFFSLFSNFDSSFFRMDGSGRLDLPFFKSISLLQKL